MTEAGTETLDRTAEGGAQAALPLPAALAALKMTLAAELGTCRLPLAQVLDLQPQARLAVLRDSAAEVRVTVQGRPLLRASLLERNRKIAVRLVAREETR